MKVWVKGFDVEMQLKNKGIELHVCDTNGKHIGDLVITKTSLIWCRGKTSRKYGKSASWEKFLEIWERL
jgi:hypothetical protein